MAEEQADAETSAQLLEAFKVLAGDKVRPLSAFREVISIVSVFVSVGVQGNEQRRIR